MCNDFLQVLVSTYDYKSNNQNWNLSIILFLKFIKFAASLGRLVEI